MKCFQSKIRRLSFQKIFHILKSFSIILAVIIGIYVFIFFIKVMFTIKRVKELHAVAFVENLFRLKVI